MKRTIGFTLACGLVVLVAGCAQEAGAPSAPTSPQGIANAGQASTANVGNAAVVRDFNLMVKCPGIHTEKTKLKWSDDQIMAHDNVTVDQIADCEAYTASQPKGYVPPPPPGVAPAAGATAQNQK